MRTMIMIVVVLAGALTAACSSSSDGDGAPDPTGVPATVVSQVAAHQDSCKDLQVLFDGADYRGDGDSMDYIDATMRTSGCYGD